MSDVFSRRNLPGSAETWGREVEKRIEGVERNALVLSQEVSSQNRNTAASLQTLAQQVSDLVGRNTYASLGTGAPYSATGPLPDPASGAVPLDGLTPITIVLDRPRVVTVSLKALASIPSHNELLVLLCYINGTWIDWNPHVYPNGVEVVGGSPGGLGPGYSSARDGQVEAYLVLHIPPGTYTFEGWVHVFSFVIPDGDPVGRVDAPFLSVNVLQPLD